MPAMGESVTEGTILEWAKRPGDAIAMDETIVEISTDKVDAEVPAPAAGTLTEVLADAGDTVTVGQVIARMTSGNGPRPAAAPSTPEPASAPRTAGDAETVHTPDGLKVTPVAARVAAAHDVDLGKVHGSGPDGRISKSDVLAFTENGASATAPAPDGNDHAAEGRRARCSRATWTSRARSRPRRPSAPSPSRTSTRAASSSRRPAARVSFTHLIAYAIARAATEQMPVMATHFAELDGKPHVIDDAMVNLGIAVDVEKKGGGRTLMVPVIRDAGRLTFPQFLDAFDALIGKARDNKLTADDLQGANMSLTNPGGIGTIASVPRLMTGQGTIVATGAIGYPPGLGGIGATIGAEKVMTMTSTYDHRIIQGAESGQFLQVVEAYLQGEHGFYEQVFADLGVEIGALSPAIALAPAAAAHATPARVTGPAPAAAGEPDLRLLKAVQAAMSLIKAHRTHGHLAARLDPLGSEPEGDPALDPEPLNLTPEVMAKIPASILRVAVPGNTLADVVPQLRETYCGTIAYEIEHIASHRQRVWLREKIETGAFRTAARRRGEGRAAAPADAGRLARALHAQGLPGPEAVLGRGPRHDRADARRDDPALRRRGRARGRDRHGPPRPAERARAQPRPGVRDDLPRVRGRVLDRGGDDDPAGRYRRRQVSPRRPGHLPGAARTRACWCAWSPTRRTSSTSGRSSRAPRAPSRPPARAPTRRSTPTPRSRSSCTATPPSPARASWRRRSTCRRSTATRSAARCT